LLQDVVTIKRAAEKIENNPITFFIDACFKN
jgi:hypothetical protein